MRGRRPNLNSAQRVWVRQWWEALQPRELGDPRPEGALATFDRGTRARLRRSVKADELLSEPSVLILAESLIRKGGDRWPVEDIPTSYLHIALAAGVLARVKRHSKDEDKTLALHLGEPAAGSDRPKMSELRFRRLQTARDVDDLFLQWQRAVQLVESTNVAQLADDLVTWLAERDLPGGRASDSVRFRWAYDYYLSSGARKAAEDPVSDKELNS